ncbi:MAG TPA: radical SAM protein, partial [Desulfurivibrionaceae bacterium]|nr:radical SAM protein [Desulfurivibrionaceae bacterium]
MPALPPAYIRLHETGELARRIEAVSAILQDCTLCPRHCHVNRLEGQVGVCRVGRLPLVSSYGPHFGEERPLVGRHGSGTIFLTGCNLRCVFCQNYEISQFGEGREATVAELGEMMLALWRQGCHNLNFVTPTHQVAQILAALPYAIERGLDLPLVYNCGGYEELATLRLLDGIFDIYMPDFKYGDSATAQRLSGVPHYVETAKEALREMHRQVGALQLDERGLAVRGLLVRHLVLPEGLAGHGFHCPRALAGHLCQHHGPVPSLFQGGRPPASGPADHPAGVRRGGPLRPGAWAQQAGRDHGVKDTPGLRGLVLAVGSEAT